MFTAGLLETPVSGGVVGPTFACLISQQGQELINIIHIFLFRVSFLGAFFRKIQLKRAKVKRLLLEKKS